MGERQTRFTSHLKANLRRVDRNMYINPSDPLYYEKVLRYENPDSPEAHFRIGLHHEEKGRIANALQHYREAAGVYPSPFYHPAKLAVDRLTNPRSAGPSKAGGIASLPASRLKRWVLGLLLLNLALAALLLLRTPAHTIVQAVKQWTTGREVIYETAEVQMVMYFAYDDQVDKIESALHRKAIDLSKSLDGQTLRLYGVRSNNAGSSGLVQPLTGEKPIKDAFAIAEFTPGVDKAVRIRFLSPAVSGGGGPAAAAPPPVSAVAANTVRTALEAYIRDYGKAPEQAESLAGAFPDNYISAVPIEPGSGSDRVVSVYDGRGGWVYDPGANRPERMFYANVPGGDGVPYDKVRVTVSKGDYMLLAESGPYLLARMNVGLGRNDATPVGTFTVGERAVRPSGSKPNVYGAAGLGLGDFAIHGTQQEESIGANLSLGCIRLSDRDIDALYPLIPRGTTVTIREGSMNPDEPSVPVDGLQKLFGGAADNSRESAGQRVFHWLG